MRPAGSPEDRSSCWSQTPPPIRRKPRRRSTERSADWVARLAPAQSRGWQIYADFLLRAGHSRIAVAAESGVYWASGTRILRDYLAARGGTVIELDLP
jgi:hypothetical protein